MEQDQALCVYGKEYLPAIGLEGFKLASFTLAALCLKGGWDTSRPHCSTYHCTAATLNDECEFVDFYNAYEHYGYE